MIALKNVRDRLTRSLEAALDALKQAQIPESFKAYRFTVADLHSQEFIQQTTSQLPTKGNYMYWFEVNKPATLVEVFKSRADKIKYKCARENKNDNSHYVYVGSCTTTKLSNRFNQHCGWGNDQTYSLQLKKWLDNTELLFTFTYVEIENIELVQLLEDQLHMDLKPLFGKPGANNKLKIVRDNKAFYKEI